jgi:hypothetical protein
MKAFINHHLFTQTGVDSASLTMLSCVMYNFSDPGDYQGSVLRGKDTAGRFQLKVDKDSLNMQVDIDLVSVTADTPDACCKEEQSVYVVNPKGFAVFHVSRGVGGYAVVVGRLGQERPVADFDSRELQEGDLLAVTLVRPGTYAVQLLPGGARGEIAVAYPPKAGKAPYVPPDAVTIDCADQSLKPNRIRISCAQGQMYRFTKPSRIKIDLVKADDGPTPAPTGKRKVMTWTKPKVK